MLVNYSKEGKKVNGWKHKPEDSPLVSEILHTIIGRKDYLIGIKKNGKVAIYKRDGKTRYTQDLELSNYSGGKLTLVESSKIEHVKLLYLDQSNNLVQTTLSLDNTESENLGLATANFTLIKNMVDGKAKDFIVARAERLAMYNEDYELKFTCDFSSAVKSEMQMFTWNKTNYIGYMDGETISGFPLYGEFGVTISDLDRNGKLNLITTDDHGLVMCYELGL